MDFEEKDERVLEIERKIKAPLEWQSPEGCKIMDLKESLFDDALRLIKRHYFREDPMCKALNLLDDRKSVYEYLELVKTWLQDTTSIVAVSTASERVVGVAVTRISSDSEKSDVYDRVQIFESIILQKIMRMLSAVITRTNAYEKFGYDSYFRVHILCVHPTYREKGLEEALLKICIEVAKCLELPAIGGMFTSGPTQALVTRVGWELMSEIRYSNWIVDDQVVFDDPGRGNYSAAFMGLLVPVEEKTESLGEIL